MLTYPKSAGLVEALHKCCAESGIKELACGSQAFIATLLFDPSMSALPIIVFLKQWTGDVQIP